MTITEKELQKMFKDWCRVNDLKPCSGEALNQFCSFAKANYQVI